ncbi:MAG: phage tail tape measure protein [Phycisphaerae bacterium]
MGDVNLVVDMKDRTGAATASATKNVRSLGKSAKGTGGQFASMAKSMISAQAAIGLVTGAVRAVKQWLDETKQITAEFGQKIKDVGLISNATAEEFTLLSDTARELGASTQFTARQAADAMAEFARAGFTAQQTADGMAGALAFAASTGADLSQATNVMSGTIKSFGLDASSTGRLADLFTGAINNSRFSAESLTEAMKLAAPAGAAFGQSVDDTVAVTSAFVDIVGTGSTAGMIFRNMMIRSANTSDKTAGALEAL